MAQLKDLIVNGNSRFISNINFNENIIPNSNGTQDIGSSTQKIGTIYATTFDGWATTAGSLGTSAGSTSQPIYIDSSGKPAVVSFSANVTVANRILWTDQANHIYSGYHYISATSVSLNATTTNGRSLYFKASTSGITFELGNNSSTSNSKFIMQGSDANMRLYQRVIQVFDGTDTTTVSNLYLNYYGGNITLGPQATNAQGNVNIGPSGTNAQGNILIGKFAPTIQIGNTTTNNFTVQDIKIGQLSFGAFNATRTNPNFKYMASSGKLYLFSRTGNSMIFGTSDANSTTYTNVVIVNSATGLVPGDTNLYSLGSSDNAWKKTYTIGAIISTSNTTASEKSVVVSKTLGTSDAFLSLGYNDIQSYTNTAANDLFINQDGGNVHIGSSTNSNQTVYLSGKEIISADIIPEDANQSLGSNDQAWKELYVQGINFRNNNTNITTVGSTTEPICWLDGKPTSITAFYVTAGKAAGSTVGTNATVEGNSNTATGQYSHAEGYHNQSSSTASHAEGRYTLATGIGAHAEGYGTSTTKVRASGQGAHAEGYITSATGSGAHAEGYYTSASGNGAHVEGSGTSNTIRVWSRGLGAHAEGYSTTAFGSGAHSEGYQTISSRTGQHVVGKFNIADSTTYIEIVGIGTDSKRDNGRTLDDSGNEWIKSTISIGSATKYGSVTTYPIVLDASTGVTAQMIRVNGQPFQSGVQVEIPNDTSSTVEYYITGQVNSSNTANLVKAAPITGHAVNSGGIYFKPSNMVLMGAGWNDYAEFRRPKEEDIKPGRVVKENGDGTLSLAAKRLERGCEIVTDTYGFGIGKTDTATLPTAATGRVLAYPDADPQTFEPGAPVCSGPGGTVSMMTEEEERLYPSRIIGTVSEIPDYDIWYGPRDVIVDGRIWIRIR